MAIAPRRDLFQVVAKLAAAHRQRIERACERIVLLGDDCGAQAVLSLLDELDSDDAEVLALPTDRFSRALHLYLGQEFATIGAMPQQRFEHAERRQVMQRQSKSEEFSSHYLGPRDVEPRIGADVEELLRHRIAALFPQVTADQILIEHFTRREFESGDGSNGVATGPVQQYTLIATFNGTKVNFTQVTDGELFEHEEPAATSSRFSWVPKTGALAVFCEDRAARRDLAMMFRDVVLAYDGHIDDMPIREFDLMGFSAPEMLERMVRERVDGVQGMSILQIGLARPFEQRSTNEANDRDLIQQLSSTLRIGRDRRDARQIYEVAYDDYGLDDFTGYELSHVKLVFRMARQSHRKAHNVTVQITAPNGLNDNSKTLDDGRRVLDQLARLGVLREF